MKKALQIGHGTHIITSRNVVLYHIVFTFALSHNHIIQHDPAIAVIGIVFLYWTLNLLFLLTG